VLGESALPHYYRAALGSESSPLRRFSPYHTRAQDFGLVLEPNRAYAYVYPLPKESLMWLAYSFEDSRQQGHIHRGLQDQRGQQEL
jgi:hypothetical protein